MPSPRAAVRQLRVLISSTRADLQQYRQEALKILKRIANEKRNRMQLLEVSMEDETQSGNQEFAVEVSKRWIGLDRADRRLELRHGVTIVANCKENRAARRRSSASCANSWPRNQRRSEGPGGPAGFPQAWSVRRLLLVLCLGKRAFCLLLWQAGFHQPGDTSGIPP